MADGQGVSGRGTMYRVMEWSLCGTSGSQGEWQEAGGASIWLRRMGGFNKEMAWRGVLLKDHLGQREYIARSGGAIGGGYC